MQTTFTSFEDTREQLHKKEREWKIETEKSERLKERDTQIERQAS
jgi:hypothetical protein